MVTQLKLSLQDKSGRNRTFCARCFVLTVLLMVLFTPKAYNQTSHGVELQDYEALVALYNATNGSGWTNKTNWLTNTDVSTWHGVTVTNQRVTTINLQDNHLIGTIPVEIGNLVELKELYLFDNTSTQSNTLTGTIPKEIGNLTSLQSLYLGNNQLSGSIPVEIGNLTSLRTLDLSDNQLNGSLPPELGNLVAIKWLFLYNNQLTGSIPTELGNLTSLDALFLDNNQLSGIVPQEIGNLTSLTALTLSYNQLNGVIPTVLGNATKLDWFDIENNYFTFEDILPYLYVKPAGLIVTYHPQLAAGNTQTISINTGDNYTIDLSFDQSLEESGCPYPRSSYKWFKDGVQIATTSVNEYTISNATASNAGVYTVQVTNSAAAALTLQSNPITVEVSSGMSHGVAQQDYDALVALYNATNGPNWTNNTNWLTDADVSTWYGITVTNQRVTTINLPYNQLNGSIPPEIGNLTSLQRIYFNNNQLSGQIPLEIGNLTSLRVVYLIYNQLSGPIPQEIGNLASLQFLLLSNNQLSGVIPTILGNSSELEWFDMDYNNYTYEGILPYLNVIPAWTNLTYEPQHPVGNAKTISVNMGDTYTIDLSFDQSLEEPGCPYPRSSYRWLKDGVEIATTDVNEYTISNITEDDFGVYTVQVLNAGAPNLTLNSEPITIKPPHGVVTSDYEALVALYNATNGPNWTNNTNWITDMDVSTWYGVNVSNSRVVGIDLYDNQLNGVIPPEIGNLASLQSLYLYNNQLSGSIPSEIVNLTSLQSLYLDNNQLSGSIPSLIGNITSLQLFDLNNNHFTFEGILPYLNVKPAGTYVIYQPQLIAGNTETISINMGETYTIELSFDQSLEESGYPYQRSSYRWFKDGVEIATTDVNEYTISNATLADIGVYTVQVTNVGAQELTLQSNPITIETNAVSHGVATQDYEALVALYNATNGPNWTNNTNWLTDADVSTWRGVTVNHYRVKGINLSSNNLSGYIPSEIGNLTSLDNIYLSSNQLSGIIPIEIGNLTSLTILQLDGNQLNSEIPATIGNLTSLKGLALSRNQLVGSIPTALGSLNALIIVGLDQNQLSGVIPATWGNVSSLFFLQLYNNNFTFESLLPYFSAKTTNTQVGYRPQLTAGNTETISINTGETYTIELSFDQSLEEPGSPYPRSSYRWFKDGVEIATTDVNELTISNATEANAGVYTVQVTNSRAPALTLNSNPITVNVTELTYDFTWVVTNTSSDANTENSLPWVITQVNSSATGTTHDIRFNIPGAGPHSINLQGEYGLNHTVNIDGNTQPENGYSGIEPKIIIDGSRYDLLGNTIHSELGFGGLNRLTNITFRNLEMDFGSNNDILNNVFLSDCDDTRVLFFNGSDNNRIQGNCFGTNRSRTEGKMVGVPIFFSCPWTTYCSEDNIVGGRNAGEQNVFANIVANCIEWVGCTGFGIALYEGVARNTISGNIFYNNEGVAIDDFNDRTPIPVITAVHDGMITGTSMPGCEIELFRSVGSQTAIEYLSYIVADANGNWQLTGIPMTNGDMFIATATDQEGTTSELNNPGTYYSPECSDFRLNLQSNEQSLLNNPCSAGYINSPLTLSITGNFSNIIWFTDQNGNGSYDTGVDPLLATNIKTLQINTPGRYFVFAENASGCSLTKNIVISAVDPEFAIPVKNTNNSGEWSLRWAIEQINKSDNGGIIVFCIPGPAPHIIDISNILGPNGEILTIDELTINKPIIIDGSTQPANGYSGTEPKIQITGQNDDYHIALGNAFTLASGSDNSNISNITFAGHFSSSAIELYSNNNVIEDNVIHSLYPYYGTSGIDVWGNNNLIRRNYIGTNRALDMNLELLGDVGIFIKGNNNMIGGESPDDYNVIVNTSPTPSSAIPGRVGIGVAHKFGECYNETNEDFVYFSGNRFWKNRIYSNLEGIVVCSGNQNNILPPVILTANTGTANGYISGTSAPNNYIEVFISTGAENAIEYLASTTANSSGNWAINGLSITEGDMFIATATDPQNNTSEFSNFITAGLICPTITSLTIPGACLGSASQFNATIANPGAAMTYLWDFGDGTTSDEESPAHTYANTGSHEVVLTLNLAGCPALQSTAQAVVSEVPSASMGDDVVLCEGSTGNVEVNLTGTGPWTLSYLDASSIPVNVDNITSSPYLIPVSDAGTYQLISVETYCDGTIVDNLANVVVNPLPDASFSGFNAEKEYCLNADAVTLVPATTGGTFTGNGISGDVFTPSQAGRGMHTVTYSVTINGCNASTQQQIEVMAPVVNILNLAPHYCINTPAVELQGSPNTGGDFRFTINSQAYAINEVPAFNPVNAGINTVTYEFTDAATGCGNAITKSTYVHELPQVSIQATETLPICAGKEVHLSARISGNNAAPYVYDWQPGEYKSSGISFTAQNNETYTVAVTDVYGCANNANLLVEVKPTPNVLIDTSFTKPVSCPGVADGELRFSVTYPNSTDVLSYYIIPHNTADHPVYPLTVNTGSTQTFTNLSFGNQIVRVVSSNGCEDSEYEYIENGGPVISLCAEAIVGAYDNTLAAPVYFNATVSRTRAGASNTFSYAISGKEVNHSGTGTYGTSMNIGPLNVYPGEEYTFSVAKDGNNTCDVLPYRVRIRTANINLRTDEANGQYKQCYSNEPKDVTVTASLNDGCTVFSPANVRLRLRRKVEGSEPVLVEGYELTTNGNNFTFNDLTVPGAYLVDVQYRDQTTWTKAAQFDIVATSILEVSVITTDVTCAGYSNGRAVAIVRGNEAPAIIKWYTMEGGTENVISNYAVAQGLEAGEYFLHVSDPRGCETTYSGSIVINEPLPLNEPTIDWEGHPCTPVASVEPTGGTAPYTFNWYKVVNPVEQLPFAMDYFNDILNRLPNTSFDPYEENVLVDQTETLVSEPEEGVIVPGTYRVEVIDAHNCRSVMEVPETIEQPTGPRTYEIAFRWTSKVKSKEKEPDPGAKDLVGPGEEAKRVMEKDMLDCVTEVMVSVEGLEDDICNSAEFLEDEVTLAYNESNYYYTLYYYDRAGNLVQTVAPQGVKTNGTRETLPDHEFVTTYAYDNIGGLVQQQSPDANVSKFVYNNKGQLRFSQNAKQASAGYNAFSYTRYDELGRVREVGECSFNSLPAYNYVLGGTAGSVPITDFDDLQEVADLEDADFSVEDGLPYEQRFPTADHLSCLSQQTTTEYSVPDLSVTCNGQYQRNLLNRVSRVHSKNLNGETTSTYYSYDAHGNVEWLVQDIPMFGRSTLAYEYDLISNKVLKVKMNENRPDAFFHKYSYDEDNRLLEAYTSTNGVIWDRDAKYAYYDHGPLKNIELGQDKVQNIQYAYTLNGWLKAINTPDLGELVVDEDEQFASDIFGMSLGYYNGDFKKDDNNILTSGHDYHLNAIEDNGVRRDLYNGNISSWVTSGVSTDGTRDLLKGYQYTYDKLNRIKAARYNTFIAGNGNYESGLLYNTTYNYDLNGNITDLTRNGDLASVPEMDNLTYHYIAGTNKLGYVSDNNDYTGRYDMDIDNQDAGNYTYDEIGNLTGDAQVGNKILWNVYGKVAEVQPEQASDTLLQKPHIVYAYDAAGNRIKKQVNYKPSFDAQGNVTGEIAYPKAVVTTFYLRDASGNIMAVYERSNQSAGDHYEAVFTMTEVPVYGSDRLGIYTPSINEQLGIVPFTVEDFDQVTLDLGKVLAKLPGTETFIAASQNNETAVVNRALYNSAAKQYAFNENWLTFTGSITGNAAIAENVSGEAQFYAVPAYTNRHVLMVYTNNKTLMPNSGDINYDYGKQLQVTRLPGSATDEYLIFTVGADSRLYYHKVDMALNGGMGEVTALNQALDQVNADYYGTLLVVEDRAAEKVKLLATRLSGNAMHLVEFEVDNTVNGSVEPVELLSIDNSYGTANMKLSPDGNRLLLFNFTGEGVLGVKPAEMRIYNITDDFRMADAEGQVYTGDPAAVPVISQIAIPEGTTASTGADFSASGNAVVFSQETPTIGAVLMADLTSNTVTTLLGESGGEVSLRSNGSVYVSTAGSNSLRVFGEDLATNYPVSMASALTGSLSGKGYVSGSGNSNEQVYARFTGLKQYELKDHLGNVRGMVSDLKTATGTGNAPTNDAKVLAYYNYYPFGLQMHGRYNPTDPAGKGGYRYGFNGKEKDDDMGGSTGAIYDYGFRIYDSRIGKFLSVDPLTQKYPFYTPYQFAGNTPIWAIDLDGLEPLIATERYQAFTVKTQKYTDGQIASLINCPIQKEKYWVVKQGKNYLYYDNEKGWNKYHAYTQKEIQNANASALIAFADKGQEVIFKTAITGVTMTMGGGGLTSRLLGNYTTEFLGQLGSTGSLKKSFLQTDLLDVTANSLLPGNIPGKKGLSLISNMVSIGLQSKADFTLEYGLEQKFGKEFGNNLLMKGLPALFLNTSFKTSGGTTTVGEVSGGASSVISTVSNVVNNNLNNDTQDEQ